MNTTTTTRTPTPEFDDLLLEEFRAYRKECLAGGTVAVGRDLLIRALSSRLSRKPALNAPQGGNLLWQLWQRFEKISKHLNRKEQSFILPE